MKEDDCSRRQRRDEWIHKADRDHDEGGIIRTDENIYDVIAGYLSAPDADLIVYLRNDAEALLDAIELVQRLPADELAIMKSIAAERSRR